VCRTATLALAPRAESPRRARTFLRARLREWGWGPDDTAAGLADQGQLVLTELVTNALRHGRGAMTVEIEVHHDRLVLRVSDPLRYAGPLSPRQVEPASQSGRGLTIIDSLSQAWGVREEKSGKTVWAQLAVPPASRLANVCRSGRGPRKRPG
jgi:anti-sigma regulatory factor (Ser/Thr protein kinase)